MAIAAEEQKLVHFPVYPRPMWEPKSDDRRQRTETRPRNHRYDERQRTRSPDRSRLARLVLALAETSSQQKRGLASPAIFLRVREPHSDDSDQAKGDASTRQWPAGYRRPRRKLALIQNEDAVHTVRGLPVDDKTPRPAVGRGT